MGDTLVQFAAPGGALIALIAVAGVIAQARASRSVGVRAADVDAGKSAGQLALDIATRADSRLEDLTQRHNALAVELSLMRSHLHTVLSEVEAIARAIRDLIQWEKDGAHGTPPHDLEALHQRLARLLERISHEPASHR